MKKLKLTNFDRDLLMAARYAYYVLHKPFLSDHDYDVKEKEYALVYENDLPAVGSSFADQYTPAERALAIYFIFSGRTQP